jgi:hypothetical protein
MKHPLLLLLLPAALMGCAGTPPAEDKATQVAAIDPSTVCERDQATGTRMISVRCRTAADREQDKRDAEAMNEASRHTRPSGPAGR